MHRLSKLASGVDLAGILGDAWVDREGLVWEVVKGGMW